MPRILLLSAYHADSHSYWCQGLLAAFPDVDWTLLTLPPRYFSWRIRGNSLSWAFTQADTLEQHYDLVIATSMVDMASLRGLVPRLGQLPTVIYFHENQFEYPASELQHPSVEPQMVNLYTALCGDKIVFNSNYNRSSFLDGVQALLKRLPDAVPPGLVSRLEARSDLIPVPLWSDCFQPSNACSGARPLTLIWNHRWEYDKGPERLLAALRCVPAEARLRVHVVGQQFRRAPAVMSDLRDFLERRGSLGAWGYIADRAEYRKLLQASHAVVSTAVHDFQGLAVLEAVAAGCLPLVPKRLVYPEWFGERACYASCTDPDAEAQALGAAIRMLAEKHLADTLPAAPDLTSFSWQECRAKYHQLFATVSQAF